MRSNELISSDEPIVERIAEEILERQRAGERPTVEQYCRRYPEHAEDLRSFLPALMVVEGLKPNSKDASGSFGGEFEIEGKRREFIGDYRILRELGRGGMGVVYEAEQQSLGRHVALKVLLRSVAGDARAAKRFESEAKAAARMHHTNIVPVFDVGSDDQHLFYAMQLIQGQAIDLVIDDLKQLRNLRGSSVSANAASKPREKSIARSLVAGQFHQDQLLEPKQDSSPADTDWTRKGGDVAETLDAQSTSTHSAVLPGQRDMSSAEDNRRAYFLSVARIGHQTAEALAYAHARGIIHRDIKPSNLLLDGNGIVWITDFGLAKTGDHGMTHTGDILGTIRYMSLERFKGQCDVRADVYSLGLTLYELLTLQPAFAAADQLKLIDKIVKSEPLAPRSLDASVPRDLETIVLKCIDKDVRRRYQSADELSEDLDRFIHDEPVMARRISLTERIARWSRRNKAMAATLAVAATLLLIINISGPLVTWRMAKLKSEAIQAEKAATFEAVRTKDALYKANMNLGAQYTLVPGAVGGITDLTDPWNPGPGERDRRGWEWFYLRSRLHQDELTLKLPPDTLDSQLNADWTRLATHDGHTIWLWDPTTGKLLDSLPLTDGEILCFAWHPNGTQLAIGLDDTQHSVKLWGTSDDKQLEDIGRIGSPLLGLAWSPNGSRLACVGWEQATVFNFQNGDSFELEAPLRNPNHTGGPDYSVGWSPDGRKLVIAIQQRVELQRKMEVWDMETQSRDVTLDGGYCIAYSPDGQTIAGGQLHHLVLCDLTDDKTLDPLPGHARAIFDLAWNPDGTLLATGADDRTIRIWDVQRREQLRVLEGHTACVRWVEWNRQGDQIASASEDGTIKFWSVAHDGSPESIGDPLTLPGVTLVWHPSGRQLCMSDQWGRFINVWDFDKNCRLESLRTEPSRIKNVSLSPDGRYLVAYNGDGTFKIWDLEDTRTTFLLPNVRGQKFIPGVSAWAEWSPSQHRSWLATALRGGVELWDVQAVRTGGEAQPRHLRTLGDENTRNRYRTLAWSRNGKRLAAGRNQGEIEIWNLETGETKYLKGGHRRPVLKMSWSHDDKSLVTCGYENYIIVWDTGNANQRRKLEGHTNTVEWVDWSPDGKRIASAGTDTSVKVWDAESGQEMMTLLGHGCFVSCVEWSPDGMSLASSDIDGVTIIWDARKGYAYNEIELDTLGK